MEVRTNRIDRREKDIEINRSHSIELKYFLVAAVVLVDPESIPNPKHPSCFPINIFHA